MNQYRVDLKTDVEELLTRLQVGIVGACAVDGKNPAVKGYAACVLRLANGELIQLCAGQHDLEYKFEVFPITAASVISCPPYEMVPLVISTPISVALLETEEWLDPVVPCQEAFGSNPIMQCQGAPGSAPESASAICRYIGGVEVRGSNGASIVVATVAWPFFVYVSGFPENDPFIRENYLECRVLCANHSLKADHPDGRRP